MVNRANNFGKPKNLCNQILRIKYQHQVKKQLSFYNRKLDNPKNIMIIIIIERVYLLRQNLLNNMRRCNIIVHNRIISFRIVKVIIALTAVVLMSETKIEGTVIVTDTMLRNEE